MADNQFYNFPYIPPIPHRKPGHWGAYLLDLRQTPPPPRPQEVATAVTNRLLDNSQPVAEEEESSSDGEANIDPQLRSQPPPTQAASTGQITVQIPVKKKLVQQIDFPEDIPRNDFLDRIYDTMSLNHEKDQLGWQTSDGGAVQRLASNEDVDTAFRTILNMKKSSRRRKPVFLKVSHLNPTEPETGSSKKKSDNTCITDFGYEAELKIVQEKLRCAQHAGPNHWCYVSPARSNEHIALRFEEITLWARKIHDNDANPDCISPPNCLRLDNLHKCASRVRAAPIPKNIMPPIHVHINHTPLSDANGNDHLRPQNLKRHHSATSESGSSDSDGECLLVSNIANQLHRKYPQLNLPQYLPILKDHGIVYADSIAEFLKDYYTDLGMADGSVAPFISGVTRALKQKKKGKKRARTANKENRIYGREESVEV